MYTAPLLFSGSHLLLAALYSVANFSFLFSEKRTLILSTFDITALPTNQSCMTNFGTSWRGRHSRFPLLRYHLAEVGLEVEPRSSSRTDHVLPPRVVSLIVGVPPLTWILAEGHWVASKRLLSIVQVRNYLVFR